MRIPITSSRQLTFSEEFTAPQATTPTASPTEKIRPLQVEKRDGKLEEFCTEKIENAIKKAYKSSRIAPQEEVIEAIVEEVSRTIAQSGRMRVEEIQDAVENGLMARNPFIAKKYILYRNQRSIQRDKRTRLKQIMDGIINVEINDITHGNANMSAHTPAGQMMTFAAESAKDYALKFLLNPRYAQAHREGDIHIHDLDYYPTKTTTCIQYDVEDLFNRGFRTKNGSVRTPQSIQSYATLATIIFQTNQNEQHGGQSIPAFDFFMAKGVRKTYLKHLAHSLAMLLQLSSAEQKEQADEKEILTALRELQPALDSDKTTIESITRLLEEKGLKAQQSVVKTALEFSLKDTRKDTHQAMEAFIHNLNTMHSRGGNQVVFSSINYGTDTSPEGRLVIRELLSATKEGLGNGETPIFPIQIFKVKEGVNYSKNDIKRANENFQDALLGKVKFETPNFDLLLEACETTAHALFPNFLFLDAPFNQDPLWKADDPQRYHHEVATMGCRTRVYENLNGPRTSIGRGNLSFTSINLPRLAILAQQEAESEHLGTPPNELQNTTKRLFLDGVERMARLAADQLYERYCYQQSAFALQFPFMMGNNVWKGGEKIKPNQPVGDVLNQGTLGIGFLGGHNAMVALYGEGHAHNQTAWNTLYEAIQRIGKVVEEYKERYSLNYSVLATPAEGLAGRFTKLDRKRFGTIPGVNDRDYYVNSFHIDVKEPISFSEKIEKEAPFHAITLGGHITYVELDGEAKKNVKAILTIVQAMRDASVGYGSINHPVDTCKQCGYKGVIYDKCPVCQSDQIARLRRITGYLTGTLESWNAAKQAEETDRVKHNLR